MIIQAIFEVISLLIPESTVPKLRKFEGQMETAHTINTGHDDLKGTEAHRGS